MSEQTYEGWTILEIMGHRRLAGYVQEATIAGAGFLQIDIYGDGNRVVTQFYRPESVYALTPTTKEIALGLGRTCMPHPVHRYELPPPPQDQVDAEEASAGEPGDVLTTSNGWAVRRAHPAPCPVCGAAPGDGCLGDELECPFRQGEQEHDDGSDDDPDAIPF